MSRWRSAKRTGPRTLTTNGLWRRNETESRHTTLVVQRLAVLLNLGLSIGFVNAGLGLNGVALGSAATYVIYSAVLAAVGLSVMKMHPTTEKGDV